jgi:hypothetical protein
MVIRQTNKKGADATLSDICPNMILYLYDLLSITRAPMTPGTQPQSVSRKTMSTEPQP